MRTIADRRTAPTSPDQATSSPVADLPTACLGELLVENRTTAGLGIEELSALSGLSVDRIAAVEAGRHDLSVVELADLLDRYRLPSLDRQLSRSAIEIDLELGTLRLRQTRLRRSVPAADRNLLRYLSLVHDRFDLPVGTDIPLKAVDLVLLRSSLALRRDEVESLVDRMTGAIRPGLVRNRNLLVVAMATGLVVAAGAIVLLPATGSSPQDPGGPAVAVDPRIDIGTPLVVERDPADVPSAGPAGPGATEGAAAQTSAADPTVDGSPSPASPTPDIGAPLIVERSASDAAPVAQDPTTNPSRGPPETND